MYIRATYKLKEYKYEHAGKNFITGLTNPDLIAFMNGDHMEIDNTVAQNLINNGMAQKVWKPTI